MKARQGWNAMFWMFAVADRWLKMCDWDVDPPGPKIHKPKRKFSLSPSESDFPASPRYSIGNCFQYLSQWYRFITLDGRSDTKIRQTWIKNKTWRTFCLFLVFNIYSKTKFFYGIISRLLIADSLCEWNERNNWSFISKFVHFVTNNVAGFFLHCFPISWYTGYVSISFISIVNTIWY